MPSSDAESSPVGDLLLREISPEDRVNGLSLGDADCAPLKTFLRKSAQHFHANNIGKTYVFVDEGSPPRVWAYITIMCSEITLEDDNHPEDLPGFPYETFPSVKISRLAVDRRVSGEKLGSSLVNWAITIAADQIMQVVGCRFVVVDSKKKAIPFYEKYGFSLLDTEENLKEDHPILYIDLSGIT